MRKEEGSVAGKGKRDKGEIALPQVPALPVAVDGRLRMIATRFLEEGGRA